MANLVHELLERSASMHPDRIAVEDRDRSWTYAEMDMATNRVANLLRANGIVKGDRVGIYLDKSLETVVAVYAVLKAGAAYVPLDPAAPVGRLSYIIGDCGLRAVLTGVEKRETWSDLLEGSGVELLVVLNEEATVGSGTEAASAPDGVAIANADEVRAASASRPEPGVLSLDLAYILYTSGSTGEPKGVMLTHRNALAFVEWAASEFEVAPDDRLSSHAPIHFDLSTFDLFATARGAATVVLVPETVSYFPREVRKFIADKGITIWYSVPSVLNMLALRGGLEGHPLPTLRTVLFAGEVFPTKYLRKLMGLLPGVRFVNLYGPTETNVCTWYDVPRLADDDDRDIPIGRAISDVELVTVGENGQPVPPGEVGELYVRGATVMQGYWGDEQRTARSLVGDPRGSATRDLCYRTGDLVRAEPDGNLRFLGRRDTQIKSRGYRIELGEIETAINAHPHVVECAVIAIPDELITNRIRAHVVAGDDIDAQDLAAWCAVRVPRYMVPDSIMFHDALGKTSTGKIDRRALLAL